MTDQQLSNSDAIARFVSDGATRAMPAEVVEMARFCLADWVGVCTGARKESAAQIVRSVTRSWGGEGRSTLLLGGQASAPVAALCNGTLAHCLDFDDTYVSGNTHTSGPLWAATLALGEELGAGESAMLAAFVTGFEAAARVGYGLGEAVTARGFHATGVFGRIAAAASAAVLLRLDFGATRNALGVAATQVSGLVGSFGTMSKPFHAGKAAMDGILSAQLAAGGFVGATDLFEPGGKLNRPVIQDGTALIQPADFSGWEILNNSFKPYAACHLTHPCIDAAMGVGVSPQDLPRVRAIRAKVGALAEQVTGRCSGPPETPLVGKFDLKYSVALALHDYAISASDFDRVVDDPAVQRTAAKVQVEVGDAYSFSSAAMSVELDDGRILEIDVPVAKGHPGNPMTWEDMRTKFTALVESTAGSSTEDIFACLRNFGDGSGKGIAVIRHLSAASQA